MSFNEREYTRESIIKQLLLIQLHATDGSAFKNCKCIQEKHLFALEGLLDEAVTMDLEAREKEFYQWLGEAMRAVRKEIVETSFNVPNPIFGEKKQKFLPHGLTEEEKDDPELKKMLSKCIKDVEETQCPADFKGDYSLCASNPIAVCRASIER